MIEVMKDERKEMGEDWLPEGNVVIKSMNQTEIVIMGLGLFDLGSSSTLINKRLIPKNIKSKQGPQQNITTTHDKLISAVLKIKRIEWQLK